MNGNVIEVINQIVSLKNPSQEGVLKVFQKNPMSKGKLYKKSEILAEYEDLKKQGRIKLTPYEEKRFLQLIQLKQTRTISGVTPVTVLTKPYPCPGRCIFCPNDPKMPKSYISSEPGAQRALANKFNPYFQTYNRLAAYRSIGHPTSKVELIVLGGTWLVYPESYRVWFIKRCFDAMNDFNNKSIPMKPRVEKEKKISLEDLFRSQKLNELAESRCVGLVLETRPEFVTKKELIEFRKLGVTKIQLGVQTLQDRVLKLNERGHTVSQTAKAFKLLRQAGFKIHAHWMPNLYGSRPEKDISDFKKMFSDKRFKPDELKIYPCSLVENTQLVTLFNKGMWKAYSEAELKYVLSECLKNTPRYCRVTRMVRDIPSQEILTGNKKTNFRQIVEDELAKSGEKLVEIRSREIRSTRVGLNNLSLKITPYLTSASKEYFLEFVTPLDGIAGFLRLSIPVGKGCIPELKNSAVIREVHVYGQSLSVGLKSVDRVQHLGLGKRLVQKACEIAKKEGFKKISVISSVGTREYYRKNGFYNGVLYQHKDIG